MRITREQYDGIIARAAARAAGKKPKEPVPLEKDIQGAIESWLRSLGNGVAWTRNRMDRATTCTVGQPDFLIQVGAVSYDASYGYDIKPRPGFYAIEIKRPGQKAKQHQLNELRRWELAGAIVGVAHSLDEVKSMMGVPL